MGLVERKWKWGLDRCGWTRESGGGRVRGGWTDELVYLVSVGVECVCVKGSLVLVLVLGWTQCLPQGVGAPPAMLRGHTAGFPKKTGWPGLRRGGVGGYNLHSPPDWGIPTTSRLYPFGALLVFHFVYQCVSVINSRFA